MDYDFDRVQIRRVFYIPKGHSEIEQEQNALRKGLVDELLEGNRAVPMDVRSFPEMEQTPEVQATSSLIVELVEKERQRQLPPAGG